MNPSDGIAVVVVTYQAAPWIERCLESLRSSRCHVIVVDNASTDGTLELIAQGFPEVECFPMPRNLGFGAANNLGIRAALERGARYVFLLNQDAYVVADALALMAGFLQAHPEVGVLSPLHCARNEVSLDEKTLRVYISRHFTSYLSDACVGTVQTAYPGLGVNAAAWFVRADIFERYGGFDPLFFMYGEDDDLLERWRHHGVVFSLFPQARVVHLRKHAAGPPQSWRQHLLQRASRRRSVLLTRVKRPGRGLSAALSVWLSQGWLQPLQTFPERRDLMALLAELLAAAGLVFEWPRIRRHQHLTSRTGPHFLGTHVDRR